MKKKWLTIGLATSVALFLAGCNKNNQSKSVNTNSKFSDHTPVKATKTGGVVKTAIVSPSPFTGVFSTELTANSTDIEVAQYGIEDLFGMDDQYRFNDKGAATLKLNRADKTATITIKKGVKWSDGKQVTAKDYEYAYEVLANPLTKSPQFNGKLLNIVGMDKYHAQKAKKISGITLPDGDNGRVIVLHFKQMFPGMKQSGNGFIHETALPYHYLKNVPFNKLLSSDKIRVKPLFYGPYKIQKLVRGQSVTWTPNKYYWRGQAKLSKIVASIINPQLATASLEKHKFDVIRVMSAQYDQVKKTKGYNFVGYIPPQYAFLAFKVGKWQNNHNVMNKNAKMNNKSLRQAISYSMNVDQVMKKFSNGLSFRIPTLIPAQFGKVSDTSEKGFTYNLKKANRLLDKAGYKKKGTYRTMPNGKPLTINLAATMGTNNQEAIIQNYIAQWKKIGLRVKLVDNRLLDPNVFLQDVQNDSPKIDMFMNSFSLATEPSPATLYGENSPMNFSRFVTKKNTQLLAQIDSPKAFESSYRIKKFHEWQKYMNDEAYVVPLYNSYTVTAVNKKLTGYSYAPSKSMGDKLPNWYYVGYSK